MDVPTFFKEHERMCRYYKCGIDCCGCPLVRKDLIQHENCFDYCAHYPEEAVAIVEQWAKEHPVKTYKSVFLEKFPNAAKENGVLLACVVAVFGEKTKPESCYESITCNDCWSRELEE